MTHLWYLLTAFWPRRFPRNESEWNDLQLVLVDHFGVPDRADVWALLAGHATSAPPSKMGRSLRFLANVALRHAIINPAARALQRRCQAELEKELARKIAEEEARKKESNAESGIDEEAQQASAPPDSPGSQAHCGDDAE